MSKPQNLDKHLNLVSSIRVEHDAYREIGDELAFAFDAIGHTTAPVCKLVTGESRTGKSSVVRDFLANHLPRRQDDRLVQTVVYAVAPPKATVKSLLGSLLHGLGDPHWHRGSEFDQTNRLHTLLGAVGCKMIVLDEFQHLCDKGQQKQLRLAADWLKTFLEISNRGLVAIGLPDAAAVVQNNPQLSKRFDDELVMPLFNWRDRGSVMQFRGVLRQFQKELAPFELPQLDAPEMALRIYLATAGRVGLLAKLLERAVRDAVRQRRRQIRMSDLAAAYRRAVWGAKRFPVEGGPFQAAEERLNSSVVHETVLKEAASERVADETGAVAVYGKTPAGVQHTKREVSKKLQQAFQC